jgi:hypothetical protein
MPTNLEEFYNMKIGDLVYVRGNEGTSYVVGELTGYTVHGWPEVKMVGGYPWSIAYPPFRVAAVADGKPWWTRESRPYDR